MNFSNLYGPFYCKLQNIILIHCKNHIFIILSPSHVCNQKLRFWRIALVMDLFLLIFRWSIFLRLFAIRRAVVFERTMLQMKLVHCYLPPQWQPIDFCPVINHHFLLGWMVKSEKLARCCSGRGKKTRARRHSNHNSFAWISSFPLSLSLFVHRDSAVSVNHICSLIYSSPAQPPPSLRISFAFHRACRAINQLIKFDA